MKKLISFCVMCLLTLTMTASEFVNLGLPSGTLWKKTNEKGFYYWDTAMKFGKFLPSQAQWEELINYCEWQWTGSGYTVVGPNGMSIYLPAAGYGTKKGENPNVNKDGYYWSSDISNVDAAYSLFFGYSSTLTSILKGQIIPQLMTSLLSVRLVSK